MTVNSELLDALKDLCDAWDVPGDGRIGGGKYNGNITKAHDAARAAIARAESAPTVSPDLAKLANELDYITPYLNFTIGDESPGHHPTMPSAVSMFKANLEKLKALAARAESEGDGWHKRAKPVAWLLTFRDGKTQAFADQLDIVGKGWIKCEPLYSFAPSPPVKEGE